MRSFIFLLLFFFFAGATFSQGWMQYLPKNRAQQELTFFDYRDAFKEWCRVKKIDNEGYYYENGEKRKAYGWKQFKRWEIQMNGWYDRKTGRLYDIDIWKEYEKLGLLNRGLTDDPGGGNWVSLAYGEEGYGNDGNGRINCMAFHPTNPNKYWIGSAWGGLWVTENNGNTWIPRSDFIAQTAIGAIAIPEDYDISQTIYLGTGDRGYFHVRGVGILKSMDGGATWQNTSLSYQSPEELSVGRILIQPSDQNVLFAATSGGLYKSTDAGENWALKKNIIGKDMEFHPLHDSIIYASTRLDYSTDKVYIYRSHDRGNSWTKVFEVTGIRIELGVSPNNPNLVYALVSNHDGGLEGFYKSDDSGLTFQLQFNGYNILGGDCTGADPGGQGGYDLCITVNPQNAQHVFIGGINVWKSFNGGSSWTIVNDSYWNCGGINGHIHVDQHWLDYQPNTNRLFALNDGGIYYSSNHGVNWENISGGLVINQPYRISNSQQVYNKIIMGQQDNGTVLWANNTIDFVGGGDGTDCLINPLDHNHQIKTANSANVWFTLDNWTTTPYHKFPNISDPYISWFKPIVLLPMDTIYYGVSNIWKSTDKGFNFTKICEVPEHDTIPLKRIAIAPSNHQVAYFHNEYNLYKTTNDFSTFTSITGNLPSGFAAGEIYQIAIKETDPNTLWITNTKWNDGHSVSKSSDGGVTWSDISEGLPDAPWYDIIYNKLQTGYEELYVCGYLGVYVKLGTAPWVPFMNGLPNVISFDMDIYYDGSDSKLRNGTHGRGIWESNLFVPEPGASGNWTGTFNTSWHDYRNWQFLTVPDGTQDVVIPAGTPYSPAIFYDHAISRSVTVNLGAQLFVTGKTLTLVDSLVVKGTLRMSAPGSEIEVDGDIRWGAGSAFSGTTSLNNKIRVYGDWKFSPGAINVRIDSADVYLLGNSNTTVHSTGSGCGFRNLHIMKSPGKSMIFDGQSTSDLIIKKDLVIDAGISVTHNSPKKLILNGNLIAHGNLYFQAGDCILQGDDANIYLGTSISFFNNLEISANSGKTKTMTSDILIHGDLKLVAGTLNMGNFNLKLTRDLVRTSGNLLAGSGKFIFRGSDRQTVTGSLIIPYLELAKPSDTLLLNNHYLICNKYDWTEGTLAVTGNGAFMISDLADDGIFGSYYLKDNGLIDFTQDVDHSIDLNGIIRIEGGNFSVSGGNSDSYWAGNMNCEIHMSGGALDIKHQGIYLMPTFSLIENITGGVIRTTKSFVSFRNDFTPSGGRIELYGGGDANLSHGTGGSFWDVKIIKSGTVSAVQNLTLNNSMDILVGTFDLNGKTVSISGKLDISDGLKMTSPASLLNVFGNVTWKVGSTANIDNGTITFGKDWYFNTGTSAQLTGSNLVKATGNLAQVIYHKDSDACFAHFMSDKTGQHLTLDVSSAHPMRVTGNLTINGSNQFNINSADLIVGGAFQTESMSITTLNGGTADLQNFILNGTLDINAGSMMVHNNFSQASGGQLILDGGSFVIDKPYSGSLFSFSGTIDLNGGFFEISYDGIQFGAGAVVNFNGGNLRIGGDFRATALNSFKPGTGTVELINTHGTNIEVYNGNYFHNLLINKTGANPCHLSYPLIAKGQLVIQNGELDTYSEGLLIEGDLIIQSSGKLTAGASEIYIKGDWINNRGTDGFAENSSSVWLIPTQTSWISSETFNELVVQASTTPGVYAYMLPSATITVSNDFILYEGALLMNDNCTINANGLLHIKNNGGLNANPGASNTVINCLGHWWDYNTTRTSMQGFTCGQSTVNFKGGGDQQLIAYGGTSFNHLNLQKPSNALLVYNPVVVSGNLTLQSGSWSYGATGLSHVFFGDFNCLQGALWLDDQNEVSFDGVQAQTISNTSGNPLNFGSFRVDRQDGDNRSGQLTIDADISCSHANFVGGNIQMADHQFDCSGDMNIYADASVEFLNNSTIRMANNKLINVDGGSLFIGGDADNQPLVTRLNTGYYKIRVDNGGLMNAEYATFEYLHTRGIEFGPGGDVFGDYPFNYCTLKDGISNGSLLYMSSASDITFHNVNFPANSWGGLYNVAEFENTGNVYMPGASGDFAGPAYEYDPYSRVHWPSGVWEGDVSSDWHNALNWRYDFAEPGAGTDVLIPSGAPHYPVLTNAKTVKSLTIEADASVNINAQSLTVNTWSDIRGALNMPNQNCLLQTDSIVWQSGSSANIVNKSRVYITGNMFIKRGSNLHMTSGEFRFTGNGESKLICHDTAQIFYLYNHKDAPYSLSLVGDTLAQLTVAGIFENGTNATLKCPSSQEWVFGGWFRNILNGHFRCNNGTIRLTAPSMASGVFRVSPGDYFHNLIIEAPLNLDYATSYSDTLRINGDLVINQNAGNTSCLTANDFKIMLMGDWINNKGTAGFIPGTSKLILPNTLPQNIRGNSVFYYVEAGSNSPGLVSFYDNNAIDHRLDIIAPVDVAGTLNANVVHNEDGNSELHLREGGYMQIGTLIQGGLVHSHNGTLIVNDLDEDYVFGTYIIDYGLVELNQEEYSSSHDLNGSITIYGGELRFTGGSGSSFWPVNLGGSYASLTMTGGLLNLPNHWIEIRNNSFTENITGGTIRVNTAFHCNAGVDTFTPTGGAVEIVSVDDSGVSIHSPNSHFWDLIINIGNYGGATYPTSNFKIKNELKVLSGIFHIYGFQITVGP